LRTQPDGIDGWLIALATGRRGDPRPAPEAAALDEVTLAKGSGVPEPEEFGVAEAELLAADRDAKEVLAADDTDVRDGGANVLFLTSLDDPSLAEACLAHLAARTGATRASEVERQARALISKRVPESTSASELTG
jgi:hypothetical protein